MFSPIGKKKYLVQIKRAKDNGKEIDPVSLIAKAYEDKRGITPTKRPTSNKAKHPGINVASTTYLLKTLHESEYNALESDVINILMEATTRYQPEKDAATLKAFQCAEIEYSLFRNLLHTAFWIKFSDKQYDAVIHMFDSKKIGAIDGYAFMVAFIKLNTIRKDKVSAEIRAKQEKFEQDEQNKLDRKKLIEEKRFQIKASFNPDLATIKIAKEKLNIAAKAYDPASSSAPNLTSLSGAMVYPAELREILKSVFNLSLDNDELYVVLLRFTESNQRHLINSEVMHQVKELFTNNLKIPCIEFIRFLSKTGLKLRDEERKLQLECNARTEELVIMQEKARKKELANKMSIELDFNFSEVNEARAIEKLLVGSTKYDRNSPGAKSLEGFECESLGSGEFKDLLRRTFNVYLNGKELGFLIKKFSNGNDDCRIHCKSFLNTFLKIGIDERSRIYLAQLEKQRKMNQDAKEEHEAKIKAVSESGDLKINYNFSESDMKSGMSKLTEASVNFDRARGSSVSSFDKLFLTQREFKEALISAFQINLTASELGALVCSFDKEGCGTIHSKTFLNSFMQLGARERDARYLQQLAANKEGERLMKEEAAKKLFAQENKLDIEIDYLFTDVEKDSALVKFMGSATKYDRSTPGAMSLDGFQCKSMSPPVFKEMLRRTFNLKLSPKEAGAIIKHLNNNTNNDINCAEFTTLFCQLGIAERSKIFSESLIKQAEENKIRIENDEKKVQERVQRSLKVQTNFTQKDIDNATQKLIKAAAGFDPSRSPSLEAFEIATMTQGLFKESIKSCFNLQLTPKEFGYIVETYGKQITPGNFSINCKEFLISFFGMGKEEKYTKHSLMLAKQRLAIIKQKKEDEEKLRIMVEKGNYVPDWDFLEVDTETALEKVAVAATIYDKSVTSAPSLEGFTGGPMKAGEFREIAKRTFGLLLTQKEMAALITLYPCYLADGSADKSKVNEIDTKKFLLNFVRVGFEERERIKIGKLELKRQYDLEAKVRKEKDELIQNQKKLIDLDDTFTQTHKTNAMNYLKRAATKYDKNSPGCVSLDAFNCKYMTPFQFTDAMKSIFNITLSPKELSALVAEFADESKQNVESQKFLVHFIRIGSEERSKEKQINIVKQKQREKVRNAEAARQLENAEAKMHLKITYEYKDKDEVEAFEKYKIAAGKYDKGAPGAMSLEAFDAIDMNAGVFREMLKRTFNLTLDGPELAAVMHFFDKEKTHKVNCKAFLNHFLKCGINHRSNLFNESLNKNRADIIAQKRAHEELLVAQWNKVEGNINDVDESQITTEIRDSALVKLIESAFKFDPASPGPAGIDAFNCYAMSPSIFKEMIRRNFNLNMTLLEFVSILRMFNCTENKEIICSDFMTKFARIGFERRNELRLANLHKQRELDYIAKNEFEIKKKAQDEKNIVEVDYDFSKIDFKNAIDKITKVASAYELGSTSAPSLEGFMGSDMTPKDFKDMLQRTFQIHLNSFELGALVTYFDTDESKSINTQEFLSHFYKIVRESQEEKRKKKINAEIKLIEKQKKYEEDKKIKHMINENELLKYDLTTQQSFLEKIRSAAQEYAVDSSPFISPMQGYKGPSMTPIAFRDLFYRIFMIKLTLSEVGVLLSCLSNIDPNAVQLLDGPTFLNWFYKLVRLEEKILLGEINMDISIETLKLRNFTTTYNSGLSTASSYSPIKKNIERPHTSDGIVNNKLNKSNDLNKSSDNYKQKPVLSYFEKDLTSKDKIITNIIKSNNDGDDEIVFINDNSQMWISGVNEDKIQDWDRDSVMKRPSTGDWNNIHDIHESHHKNNRESMVDKIRQKIPSTSPKKHSFETISNNFYVSTPDLKNSNPNNNNNNNNNNDLFLNQAQLDNNRPSTSGGILQSTSSRNIKPTKGSVVASLTNLINNQEKLKIHLGMEKPKNIIRPHTTSSNQKIVEQKLNQIYSVPKTQVEHGKKIQNSPNLQTLSSPKNNNKANSNKSNTNPNFFFPTLYADDSM